MGIIFRISNVAAKPFWIDESYTVLRASGHSYQTAESELYNPYTVITADDLLRYQRISPETNKIGTIKGLATEEPQHPLSTFYSVNFGDKYLDFLKHL